MAMRRGIPRVDVIACSVFEGLVRVAMRCLTWLDDLENGLHLRIVKCAAVTEGAGLIRRPHELRGFAHDTGIAPRTARDGVFMSADVVPAHDRPKRHGHCSIQVAERLLLK